MKRPAGKPESIDSYLAALDPERRALLEELRRAIHRALPGAEECISYSMPAFRVHGHVVAGFAATARGGSYYPFSGTTLSAVDADLVAFSKTKSAVHFTRERPLPEELVRKLVAARLREVSPRA
ncbi:MAG: DUF1801 domain-containing protein [Polyangiaceae bacterium]